jgi:hypothetical protein
MSIDLSKCDRYDYHLVFRPDGQTIVNATKLATNTLLKAQIMNIPSRYATSQYKAKKFYFVLHSAQMGRADAIKHLDDQNNLYLYLEGLNNDSYSNFYNLANDTLDATPQHIQPSPLLFHVKVSPIKNRFTQMPYGTLTAGAPPGHIDGVQGPAHTSGFVGKVFVKHGANIENIIGSNIQDHCVPRVSATPGLTDSYKSSLLHTALTKTATTVVLEGVTEVSAYTDTLNGAINDSVTTLVVGDNAANLNAIIGSFIEIGTEILLVTFVNVDALTVVRAQLNTLPGAHADTDNVTLLISHMPVPGDFIRINNELMLVNIVNTGNITLNVTRGSVHTLRAIHADGSDVFVQRNEQSYFETTVRAIYNDATGTVEVKDVANENFELEGATVDVVSDNQINRMKEISNPFGNEIRVGLAHTTLNMQQVGTSTVTEYALKPTKDLFYGAFSINFSILCCHENPKTTGY